MSQTNSAFVFFKTLFLNWPCLGVWILSFALAFDLVGIDADRLSLMSWVQYAAPLANGYKAASRFSSTSYIYFALMQPISLLVLASAWWKPMVSADYSEIQKKYLSFGTVRRGLACLLMFAFFILACALIFVPGGQEPPGIRINSSRLALALFGPFIAGGLSIFLAFFALNVVLTYCKAKKEDD